MQLSIADEVLFPEAWQRQMPSLLFYAYKCFNGTNLALTMKADVG
jgi:hypothetical protein